jgi:rubrerythrin
MPLENFGSIMNFAEDLESQDRQFYETAAGNSNCRDYYPLFARLAGEAARNRKTVQQIRRENVTEMILESVKDFRRDAFCEACDGAVAMTAAEVLETATRLEARADRYYAEAAEKLGAMPEVSRALKALCKSRKSHIALLLNTKR